MTKDGVIIVCHDKNFQRQCDDQRDVIETNYKDIPAFGPKIKTHFSKWGQEYVV
jgi:hypothetical protein